MWGRLPTGSPVMSITFATLLNTKPSLHHGEQALKALGKETRAIICFRNKGPDISSLLHVRLLGGQLFIPHLTMGIGRCEQAAWGQPYLAARAGLESTPSTPASSRGPQDARYPRTSGAPESEGLPQQHQHGIGLSTSFTPEVDRAIFSRAFMTLIDQMSNKPDSCIL